MSKNVLIYKKPYLYNFQDGTNLQRMFDNLRLGDRYLKSALVAINIFGIPIGMAHSECLGCAWVKVEGIHQRGDDGQKWFIFGRFRNDQAPKGVFATEGKIWSHAFFLATHDSWSTSFGLLEISRESYFVSPLRKYEKAGGMLGRTAEGGG